MSALQLEYYSQDDPLAATVERLPKHRPWNYDRPLRRIVRVRIEEPRPKPEPSDFQLSVEISDECERSTEDRNYTQVVHFLEMVYRLDHKGSGRLAIDLIIDQVDDALNGGDFETCEAILGRADTARLSDSSLVTLLGITRAAKTKLSKRSRFFEQAFTSVAARRGLQGADTLLAKYR